VSRTDPFRIFLKDLFVFRATAEWVESKDDAMFPKDFLWEVTKGLLSERDVPQGSAGRVWDVNSYINKWESSEEEDEKMDEEVEPEGDGTEDEENEDEENEETPE
jgi:hypothetical protein